MSRGKNSRGEEWWKTEVTCGRKEEREGKPVCWRERMGLRTRRAQAKGRRRQTDCWDWLREADNQTIGAREKGRELYGGGGCREEENQTIGARVVRKKDAPMGGRWPGKIRASSEKGVSEAIEMTVRAGGLR